VIRQKKAAQRLLLASGRTAMCVCVYVYSIRVSEWRIRLFLTADVSQREIRHGLKLFLASGDRRLNRQMLKVVPGPKTRVIDTSFTIRVSGRKTKTSKSCAVGRSKSQNRAVGKEVEMRNERTEEEKKVR
jgi:hypothetical protein